LKQEEAVCTILTFNWARWPAWTLLTGRDFRSDGKKPSVWNVL